MILRDGIAYIRTIFSPMSSGRLSLRGNFSWTFLGNLVYNAAQMGVVILIAKLTNPEMVGRYTLALAITAPVFMFINGGLNSVISTDVKGRHPFSEYLGFRILSLAAGLAIIAMIVAMGDFSQETMVIIAITTLAKTSESFSDVMYGLVQKQERLDMVAGSLKGRGVQSLGVMAVLLFLTRSFAVALLGQALVWIAVLCWFDIPNARKWEAVVPKFNRPELKNILLLSLPLAIVAGLNSLDVQVPRYFLEHYWGERELGIFSAIASLGMIPRLVAVSLSRSALPRLSRLYAFGSTRQFMGTLSKLVLVGGAVGTAGVLVAAFWGEPFLKIIYTADYVPYNDVFIMVMVGVAVVTAFTFLGTAVTAAQQFAVQVGIHILKILAVSAVCFLLVEREGAMAAAWAILFGGIVSSLGYSWQLIKTVQQKPTLNENQFDSIL